MINHNCRGYVIEKRDLTHGGGWVPAVNYVNPKYNHAVVPRLIEGTKYEFRVFAENLQGRSEPLNTEKPVVAKNQYGMYIITRLNSLGDQRITKSKLFILIGILVSRTYK